jgi:hypothetical protein
MFKKRTLFVVGAGASKEFNMPLGIDLAAIVGQKMDVRFGDEGQHIGQGDRDLYETLKYKFPADANNYLKAAWLIRDGVRFSSSIDDFLDIHTENSHVNVYGKAAIAKSILEAERTTPLYPRRSEGVTLIDFPRTDNTWLMKFMRILSRGMRSPDRIFENVSFIIFNYDRCLEQFLFHALQKTYGMRATDACEILATLTVIHPYGLVGNLQTPIDNGGVGFGAGEDRHSAPNYLGLTKQIKTYSEQMLNAEMLAKIRFEIAHAACIVFLGFAYHEPNMRLLTSEDKLEYKTIFGSAFKMSTSDTNVVLKHLSDWFVSDKQTVMQRKQAIQINNDLTAAALFDFYAKSLPADT